MAPGTFGLATNWLRRLLPWVARFVRPVARHPQLGPVDLVIEGEELEWLAATAPATTPPQPPPIPAEARLPLPAGAPPPSDQERAWRELMNGRHPRMLIRSLARGVPLPADSRSL
jgi:hypothetical protein